MVPKILPKFREQTKKYRRGGHRTYLN